MVDFSQSVLSKSAMIPSLPKLNLPVFDGDPCGWPNWYGMFKALVQDQQLSKTQKMIYLKASVKGTAEKAKKMWDEEVVGIADQNKPLTAEEVLSTLKVAVSRRYADGRYEVAIPWKDDEPPLYCKRTTAEDRLYSLEKHLQRRPDVAEKYGQVMEANEAKGYIRKLEPAEIDDGPSWYLPHFPLGRENRQTTEVRIVYDSAARYGGVSLNNTMLPGPKL